MAGFQQAANALTGAYGTIGGRIGVYNELVGKNKEQREQLIKQNEELNKKNEELDKKNEQLQDFYDTVRKRQEYELQLDKEAEEEYNKQVMRRQQKREENKELKKMIERRASIIDREWERKASHMSKNMMTEAMFGDLSSGSGGGI